MSTHVSCALCLLTCICVHLLNVPHLLFGDADIAQVRLEGLVWLLGEYPVAAERLTENRLQEEVRLLRVVHHDHEERHSHDQTGGNQRLPLWRERECTYDKSELCTEPDCLIKSSF